MIVQRIYLPFWDWLLVIFYWVRQDDAEEILQALQEFACSERTLRQAKENLGETDSGLTYTNNERRATVMVISNTSSREEFWDTLDHEKGHAVQHIGSAVGLDPGGEEKQYLAGEIARKMYPVARRFICDC